MHVGPAVITFDVQLEDINVLDTPGIDRYTLTGIAAAHQGNTACRAKMVTFGDAAPDISGNAALFAN